jgi:N-acetylmuramic acid 6-phosphate etherase
LLCLELHCPFEAEGEHERLCQEIFRCLYNARMTSQPKKHKSEKRQHAERQSTENRFIDPRPTEQRNEASRNLDRMMAMEIVRLMNGEDRKVAIAVGRELPAIARAVDAIVNGIRKGGRLFYVGAGSSGRMGVLDAAECPPTFGTSPKLVQALIAGGRRAITHAVEGAEDSTRNGERDLRAKKPMRNDVVVGIAASGTTPYVLGALNYARRHGATTVAVTSNLRMPVGRLAQIVIAPEVGPEVLTGSTRLKAGTSQKMVLNMLSTAVMARLGHVYENLMIDVVITNEKVAERALRILAEASGRSVSAAEHALGAAGHNMRAALVMLKRGVGAKEAKKLIAGAGGDLRKALGE